MTAVRIVTPPARAVSVAEVRTFLGDGGSDAQISMLIAAAQAEIEPPRGVWGRAFGRQTLEMTFPARQWACGRLPLWYAPVASVLSVKYVDGAGAEQTLDPTLWLADGDAVAMAAGATWPACAARSVAARVRYTAGDVEYPEPVKLAIILMVQQMRAMTRDDILVKKEVTEGVGSTEWDLSPDAAAAIRQTAERLLSPYRLIAVV